jgi:hypothetical protein
MGVETKELFYREHLSSPVLLGYLDRVYWLI